VSSLTISIDRTSLSLTPLVLSAVDDANPLGIVNFTEPGRIARIRYAPPSDIFHGDSALAMTYQQALLAFDVVTDQAATEQASRDLLDDLRDALGQFPYTTTTIVNGATPQVWTCDPGSVAPIARTWFNLENLDPVASVTIPCYPIPGA
jgi:hypothetical protein